MKQKIFTLLVMVMVAMTASADKGFVLTKGANPHGTTTIKVGDAEADIAAEGAEVTVVVEPAKDYYVATVVGRLYTTWGGAKTRGTSIKIGDKLLATKVKDKDNTYNLVHMKDFFYFRNHLCITFELLGSAASSL